MHNRLKEFRDKAQLTQGQLAERAGCSLQHISRMERGERGLSKKWAVVIAPILGTTWTTLMEEPPAGGLSDVQSTFEGPATVVAAVAPDEALAAAQEAVAAELAARDLPRKQSDILPIARAVLRDMAALEEMPRFPATLELRASEVISKLQQKWRDARDNL